MDYYHVQITPKSDASRVEVKLDLTKEELMERFVTPYRKGLPIFIDGTVIPSDEIERIRISKTAQDSQHVGKIVSEEQRRRIASGILDFTGSNAQRIANKGEDVTDEFIWGPPGTDLKATSQNAQLARLSTENRNVFVVHGRNEKARKAIFEFLRSIGLDPLEWSEAAQSTGKATPYIGEILDAAFSRAHAVVVLLTPDDEARLREPFQSDSDPPYETQLTGQARPNVLFEAGMAMERDQDRTLLVELGSLRPFSDIAGRHTIRLDNSGQQRQQLAKRLQSAGCPVNWEGTDWHTAGGFEAAVVATIQESSEPTTALERQSASAEARKLSDDANDLLMEAAEDSRGTILAISTFGGLSISTNGRNFVEAGSPQAEARSEARWKQAFRELVDHVLIEDPTGKGQIFQVTQSGFQLADSLLASKKSRTTYREGG